MTNTRRLDLDGLRGLAVLLVVGFHAGVPALRGAFVAVDVFFVLSGFFLATTLTRRLATGEAIRPLELATRRLWRLLPVLAVVLVGTLATTLLYAPIDRPGIARHMVPVSAFAGNLAFAANGVNYFANGLNPVLHTWTLGVELQLALLFPLLVLLFAAWGEKRAGAATGADRRWIVMQTVMLGVAAAGVLSFALSVAINGTSPMWAYFGPHTRLWSFCAGAMMAFFTGGGQSLVGGSSKRIGVLQLVGLGLLVAPSFFYEGTLEYPGVMALAPVGGTLFLLAAGGVATSSVPGALLASGPLVGMGRLSYAWYLWHLPLMVLGGVLVPTIGVGGRLLWGLAGLLAARMTHRLLERPTASGIIDRTFGRRPLSSAVAVCAGLALMAMGAAWASARHVEHSIHRKYLAARNDHVPHDCWGRLVQRGCDFGAAGGTALALIGDSHASHWLAGLEQAGRERGWKIVPYVMGACPVADLRGLLRGAARRMYGRCAAFQEEVMRRLETQRPQAVILSNADYYMEGDGGGTQPRLPAPVWTEGLRRTYARIQKLGIPVLVMRDVPWAPFDVPGCLSRRAARLPLASDCSFVPDRAFMAAAHQAQDRAASGLGIRFVDLNDRICATRRCATERNGMVLYTDDDHISSTLSRSLAPVLGERVALALRP